MSKARNDSRILRGMEKQLKLRDERLAAGEKPTGWKVGFGAPAALEKLDIDAPLVGFLTGGTRLPSESVVSIAGWTRTAVEPEIALRIGMDVGADADRETARAAIASMAPVIELADVNFPPDDVEAILAANIFHRYLIEADADAMRAGFDLKGLSGRVYRDGVEAASTTDFQAITGDYVDTVRHVADLLSAFGLTLRAGEIIIAGSIVPPVISETSETIRFDLDPLASVTVRVRA